MKFKTMYGKNKMKVPEINVIECDIKIIDHIMFEYEMIQRAREAEIILNQMLYNDINHVRRSDSKSSSSGFSSFMWKLKSSSHKLNKNIPEIKICPCQVDLRDEEDMEEEMIQRGKEARMVRERLLSEVNATMEERKPRSCSLEPIPSEPMVIEEPIREEKRAKFTDLYGTISHGRSNSRRNAIRCKSYAQLTVDDCQYKKRKTLTNIIPLRKSKTFSSIKIDNDYNSKYKSI